MRTMLALIALLSAAPEAPRAAAPSVELRFPQPMTSNRTVTVVARGVTDGTLRLFNLAGREVASERFETGPAGQFRWRLSVYALASGVYLLAAEWPGGRVTKLVVILR